MNHVARNFVFTQPGGDLADLFFRRVGAAAHPEAKRPERRHRRLAGQFGVFIEDFPGRPQENEQVKFVIPEHQRVDAVERMAEVAGDGRGGVQEHAIAAAAHEKRDGLVHPLVLDAVGIVRPQDDFLAAFVQAGERFAAAENLFAGRESEHRVHAARIIGRAPHKGEGQDGRERGGVVRIVVGFGEQLPPGVAEFDVPGIFPDGDRAKVAGVAVAVLDPAVFPGMVLRHFAGQHQFLIFFMVLRAARQADSQGSRRNKFNGKRECGIGGVFVFRKFVRGDRFDDGQHVVEGLPGEILGALPGDFARAGGRIEIGEFVRQIIKVGEIPEIAADINRIIEQRRDGIGRRQPAGYAR